MPLELTSGPVVEPVTLAEAKAHLRVDTSAEDTLIASLIVTSRLHVEAALSLALITQSWSYFLDAWPERRALTLPLRPLRTVTAVRLYGADDTVETLPANAYVVDAAGIPPRLVLRASASRPKAARAANGIEVAFIAGFGDAAADVPAPIRQAILLLIAHWYEQREPVVVGEITAPMPPMASELLAPYRQVRL